LKYGVNRRQIQKWLAQESSLRTGLRTGLNTIPLREEEEEEEEGEDGPAQDHLHLFHAYQKKASQGAVEIWYELCVANSSLC
jgi:hypothetical protein